MSVEANAPMNDSAVIEHNNPINDPAASAAADDALGAVWDRLERDNGAARGEGGKFVPNAADGDPQAIGDDADNGGEKPLEGGEGEGTEEAEISTPAAKVPLPATMTGLDEHWGKLPPEAQEAIAASQAKLHKTMSDQGRALSAYKPIADVFGEFKEYFDGTVGNYKGDEAVRYLFGLQRAMDANPVETILQIADTYELRQELAKVLGAPPVGGEQQTQQTDTTQALLAEISQLKKTIAGLADPSKIDERINTRLTEERTLAAINDVISRTSKDMPLYAEVEEQLPDFIKMSWRKLGDTASHEAVHKHAYDMAVNADPDLRKKAAALQTAATTDPKLVADARKANSTNIRSTSTGRPRDATEEEALGAVWDKHKRA